jgi:hypothetical protein
MEDFTTGKSEIPRSLVDIKRLGETAIRVFVYIGSRTKSRPRKDFVNIKPRQMNSEFELDISYTQFVALWNNGYFEN